MQKWIKEKNSDLLPAVILFETESDTYPKTYFNNSIWEKLTYDERIFVSQ